MKRKIVGIMVMTLLVAVGIMPAIGNIDTGSNNIKYLNIKPLSVCGGNWTSSTLGYGDVVDSFDSPGDEPAGLAWDGTYLWNVDLGGGIYKLNPNNGDIEDSFNSPGPAPGGLTWDGEYLWNVDHINNIIYKLTTTGTVVDSFDSPGDEPEGLACGGGFLWVGNNDISGYNDEIYKVHPAGFWLMDKFDSPGMAPMGLAWDEEYIWNADTYDDKIYRLAPSNGNILYSFDSPGEGPTGLTWDGQYLWNADAVNNKIYKIEVLDVKTCPPGMVSYWQMDEGSGAIVYDSFDGNDGGILTDGDINDPHWCGGQVDGALCFAGDAPDCVAIGHDPSLNFGAEEFALEAWIKYTGPTDGSVDFPCILSKRPESNKNEGYMIGLVYAPGASPGTLILRIQDSNYYSESGGTPVDDGQWHHIVVQRCINNEVNFYVDGQLDYSHTSTKNTDSDGGLTFGLDSTSSYCTEWEGALDEIAVYDKCLPSQTILQHYLQGHDYCHQAWTIIAYLCGDNDLDYWTGRSLTAMYNVLNAEYDVNIVVLVDRFDSTHMNSKAFYLDSTGDEQPIYLPVINYDWVFEVNMGDSQTLRDFSRYCVSRFPASHYLVILQNHGDAFTGCCNDRADESGWLDPCDRLHLDELRTAFSNVCSHLGKKVDIVYYNACMMNSLEVAYELEEYVDFQVGSETIAYASSLSDIDTILQHIIDNPSKTPQEVSEYITEKWDLVNCNSFTSQCVSTIDLNKIQTLADQVNMLAKRLINILPTHRNQLETARDETEYYFCKGVHMFVDLYNLANNINSYVNDPDTKNIADNIMNTIGHGGVGDAVTKVCHTSSANFCHGLGIFFPKYKGGYEGCPEYPVCSRFTADTKWDEFLEAYFDSKSIKHVWFAEVAAMSDIGGHIPLIGETVIFGEKYDAEDGYDENDLNYTDTPSNITFHSKINNEKYSIDIRQGPAENNMWNLSIEWEGSASTTIHLTWNVSCILRGEYQSVSLFDKKRDISINMRANSSYNIDVDSGEIYQLKIICKQDIVSPSIEIVKPENALYLFDQAVIPLTSPFILGGITVTADTYDKESGMDRVECYIDDELMATDEEAPYEMTWDEAAFGGHTIKAMAYDNAGNSAADERDVWIFNWT